MATPDTQSASRPDTRGRAVVIGAGVGGLSCAIGLAARGLDVTVVEASDGPGGKMRPLRVGQSWIDSGPTVFTMRWVFEQLFELAGASFAHRVPCIPLQVLARHAWRDHPSSLDLHADAQQSTQAIAAFSGPAEARRFQAFCREARELYAQLEGPYIRSERPTMGRLVGDLGWGGLQALMRLGPFTTLWKALARRFHDPRLQQLFGRYATYCGASPWQAPATLMLIAQVEMDGVWAIEGGMVRLAQAMADVAAEQGVRLSYGSRVQHLLIEGGRACGVRLEDGQTLRADTVVFNGDSQALATGLLGAEARQAVPLRAPAQRSLSAMTWSIEGATQGWPLTRHNVFFDHDYRSEFDDVFSAGRFPKRPTVYICAQDRGDTPAADRAGIGPERLLMLVNAPACGTPGGQPTSVQRQEMAACQTQAFELIRACGLDIPLNKAAIQTTTPWDFAQRFPATGGSLYGPVTHGWMSSFSRGSARSAIPGLFLAGGSVHPGPGVPMATLSGRLAAETAMAHLDSTSRSSRVVIAGGISTRSAIAASTA